MLILQGNQNAHCNQYDKVYLWTRKADLFDSLLALLRITVSRSAQTALMSCDKTTYQRIFSDFVDRLLVALCHVWTGVEFRPVDLEVVSILA